MDISEYKIMDKVTPYGRLQVFAFEDDVWSVFLNSKARWKVYVNVHRSGQAVSDRGNDF